MAKVYMELSEFKPWSGAEDAWNKIVDAGMLDEFDALLDATFPSEGGDHECYIDETELNDMLRFEADEWLSYLGLSDEEDEDIEESTKIRKRRVTAAYGGWNKFYGLPDVEFTVPNDMDDPTIYYNGKYYNYYDVEDFLWSMFGEYCEETGVIQDEDMFEQWISENPDEVYGILSEIQPKKSRGRGVRRDGEMYTSASRRSRGRRVMAARNAKKTEVYVVQEYTGYGNGWEDIAVYPDTSSDSLRQAKQDVKDYRDNGYQARIITRRVDNPDYTEPANEITYDEAVVWVEALMESGPYEVDESYFSAGKSYVLYHKGYPLGFAQIYIDEDNTVRVRHIRVNRTKQVRSIAELEKEVNRLANL